MSARRLFAAVRDLDPPGGGAERSLAALLNGIAAPGPTLETAPLFVPMSPAADAPTHPAWTVRAFASHDRGDPIGLLEPEVDFTTTDLPIEGFWSKVAWGLRERKGERRRRKWAHDRHIGRRSPQFAARVGAWLDGQEHAGGIGLTQLEWAPGAAQAFTARGMPYVMFVRDDTVFRLEELFRPVMEGAALVCAAGEGLLTDIRSRFAIQHGHSVPLPIDFGGRFGSMDDVTALRSAEQAKRPDGAPPTIGIMVVTDRLRLLERVGRFIDVRSPRVAASVGTVSSMMSTLSGGGALYLLAPYLKLAAASPLEFRNTNVMIGGIAGLARVLMLSAAGLVTFELLLDAASLLPAITLGTWIGTRYFRAVSAERFFATLQWMLLLAAALLAVKGVGLLLES